MPEGFSIGGDKIRESVDKMAGGSAQAAETVGILDDKMKDFARGNTQVANTLLLVAEAMVKSQDVFGKFSDNVERSSLIMQSFGKAIRDVSLGLTGATSSVEGFMSATQILGTKTFPEMYKNLRIMSKGYDTQIHSLKESKEAIDNQIMAKEKEIATMTRGLDALIQFGDKSEAGMKATSDLGDKLGMAKEDVDDLKDASTKMGGQIKEASETATKFGVALTKSLGWITLLITATVALAGAYDNSIKAKREVLYTLGRLGAGYSANRDEMDKFNASFTSISTKWGMMREAMASAVAPLVAVGAGVGGGGIGASIAKVRETLEEAANITGMMLRGFGVETGLTTKALGTISTAFDIKGKALAEVFGEIASAGQKSVLGMSRYISELTSMYEITRRHGGGLEGTTNIMLAFDEQIKKGTLSIESLARLSTPGMMSLEQQGAIVTLMKQFAPEKAKELGIQGNDVLENIYQAQVGAEKNSTLFAAGIIEMNRNMVQKTGVTGQGEISIMLMSFIKQTTGIQISSLKAVEALTDPEKMEKLLNPEKGKSLEDLMGESLATYKLTKTFAERTTFAVEKMRDIMVSVVEPALKGAAKAGGAVDKGMDWAVKGIGKMFGFNADDEVDTGAHYRDPKYKKELMERTRWEKAHPEEARSQEIAQQAQFDVVNSGTRGVNIPPSKATGGYISETAQYMLHAGEQVRKPGEGGGGDISVSLGGLNVTVGDRGDLRGQFDEAFTRMKNETLKEVERQWDMAQSAH